MMTAPAQKGHGIQAHGRDAITGMISPGMVTVKKVAHVRVAHRVAAHAKEATTEMINPAMVIVKKAARVRAARVRRATHDLPEIGITDRASRG